MDVRNVQKTGNMHYVYLPTTWCKKYDIGRESKVSLVKNNDGSLSIHPVVMEKKKVRLQIDLSGTKRKLSPDVLNKLIVASYINPADSFVITLNQKINMQEIFDQKTLLNIEFVDFDAEHISCESPMTIEEPFVLLKTMIKKVKSLLYVMQQSYHETLIAKYEDEIDKSKLLIEKAVIGAMVNAVPSTMRPVELHYTALIAKELERLVDHLKELSNAEQAFLSEVERHVVSLSGFLEKIETGDVHYPDAVEFLQAVSPDHRQFNRAKLSEYHKIRIVSSFRVISETIMDWIVTTHLLEQR